MNKKLKLWELNRLSDDDYKAAAKNPIVLVLDDIRSHENVGAFFRTADAFCVEKIILCGITPCPPQREIHKTALGATETVSWEYNLEVLEAVKSLQKAGYLILAIEQSEQTVPLHLLKNVLTGPVAFVFGNEVKGVKQSVIDVASGVIEIPQFGTKHSLNVSVCAGIVLWECVKHLDKRLRS